MPELGPASATLSDTAPVRPEAAFDVGRLQDFLAQHAQELGADAGDLKILQFPKGYSNLTYLLESPKGSFVVRRAPPGVQIKSAHDMGREFRTLQALSKVTPRVPRALVMCEDPEVIGTPFYVMTRLEGVILRSPPPPELALTPAAMRAASGALIDALAEIHRIDLHTAGLEDLGKPQGYVERQVKGWTERWFKAGGERNEDVEAIATWLASHLPTSTRPPALLHNDFKYDNVVLDRADLGQVVGILDWEMSTLGDPLADLGTSLSIWVQPGDPPELSGMRLGPTDLPGNLTRSELVQRYTQATGTDVSEIAFFYILGLFKFAVVAKQLHARFERGLTTEKRMARMGEAVKGLATFARSLLANPRIEGF